MLITVDHLDFSYGVQEIFHQVNFSVKENEKIGLIGPNGSGKTTFFKLLTGELDPEGGSIHTKSGLSYGYLKQEAFLDQKGTLHDILLNIFSDLLAMEDQMAHLQDKIDLQNGDEQLASVEKLTEIQERYADMGGYEYPSRIRGVINGLGFSEEDLNNNIDQFSGGQKTRIALGSLLLRKPDLLLLDEPTNYLDFDTMSWLENYLRNENQAFIVISHDRYFLDNVCTRIAEIENHGLITYTGNYSEYARKKAQHDAARHAEIEKNNKEIARQQHIIDQLRARHSVKSIKRARSREVKLEKMDMLQEYHADLDISLTLKPKIRSADDVLSVTELTKSFPGHPLFSNLSFDIYRGDKVGIIGPNGVGKSTLLKILLRQIPADSGRIKFGQKVSVGYYSQEGFDSDLYGHMTLIDAIRSRNDRLTDGEIRNLLARFLFRGDAVFKTTDTLSGGEMARIRLAALMVSEANLLLLDEPTNHIDMQTKEILEDAIDDYEGTVIAVSHDRYFLNQTATRIFALSHEGLEENEGNYDDYFERQQQLKADQEQKIAPVLTKTEIKNRQRKEKQAEKAVRNQKKALKQLENTIEKTDARIAEIETIMCQEDFYNNPEQVKDISTEYHELKKSSDALLEEWEELAAKLED